MKKLFGSIALVFMIFGISSCGNDLYPEEDGNHRYSGQNDKPMIKTIRMSFGGDYVSESEEPLLRAEDGNTFVGINVYYTQKDMPAANEVKYAYGLFSYTNGISIDLSTGYTYRFEATILKEKDDKLWDYGRSMYGEPFTTSNGNTGFLKKDMDNFIYTFDKSAAERFNFKQLSVGTAYVDAGSDLPSRYGDVRYPRVKRYYGEVNDFDPSDTKNVEINMNYKTFGLKLNLVSIPGETSVSVLDITDNGYKNPNDNAEYYLRFPKNLSLNSTSEDSKTWEGIFSLNDLKQSSREFKLRFIWNKGQGQTESFDHTFTAEAKKKKVLNITIDGTISETKSGNIIFKNLDDNLTEEEPENVTNFD